MPKRDELLEKMLRKIANDDTLQLTIERIEKSTIFVVKGIRDFSLEMNFPVNRVDGNLRQLVASLYQSYLDARKK